MKTSNYSGVNLRNLKKKTKCVYIFWKHALGISSNAHEKVEIA